MADYTINLNAEIDQAHAAVIKSLEHGARFAVIGDQFARLPANVELPAPIPVLQIGSPDEAPAFVRDSFSSMASSLAVISMVSSFESYLSQLMLLKLFAEKIAQSGKATSEEFNRLRWVVAQEMRGRPTVILAKLILAPSKNIAAAAEWLDAIYSVRVCLTHREGLVGIQDVDSSQSFTARWRKAEFYAGDRRISELPLIAYGGETIRVTFSDEIRTWKLGDRTVVDPQDCVHMNFALSSLAGWVKGDLLAGIVKVLEDAKHSQ